jgi:hypothetical protein
MELVNKLIERYGYNEPIFTEEIMSAWSEYSKTRVYQLLKKCVGDGLLCKFDTGVYYVPTKTILGKPSCLGLRQVVEKKYIRNGEEVYGYYAGLTLLNALGLTTQMPNTLEVVTSKETTRVREAKIRNSTVILRKARTGITKENVYVMILLEAFNATSRLLESDELKRIRDFVQTSGIRIKDIFAYAGVFPGKAIKNLLNNGVENVIA